METTDELGWERLRRKYLVQVERGVNHARNLHAHPYYALFPRLYVASRRARAVRAKCSLAGLTNLRQVHPFAIIIKPVRQRQVIRCISNFKYKITPKCRFVSQLTMRAWPVARSIFDAPLEKRTSEQQVG